MATKKTCKHGRTKAGTCRKAAKKTPTCKCRNYVGCLKYLRQASRLKKYSKQGKARTAAREYEAATHDTSTFDGARRRR